jgi:Delta24-sterol reductase
MQAEHERRVAALAEQVKSFYARQGPFKVYHGSTNSTRVLEFDRRRMVDLSGFTYVLGVDPERKTALVEANVPMDTLVRATLRYGLVPPVVMEFPGITVAGGLQGGAGESSSFKWGGFHETLNWFEMVLGNGEVVRASRELRPDLFFGAAGSYGSLGVVTAAEVQLIPAAKYVELEHLPVRSFEQAVAVLAEQTAKRPDFVDGILFGRDQGVIMVGTLAETTNAPVVRFSRAWDDWFYLHARRCLQSNRPRREAVPLADYLFRYDRGGFWMGEYAFKRFNKPYNRFTRWLADSLMHTRKMYEALQASGVSQEFIIQDLALPPERAVEFLEYVDHDFGLYPLWLCPLKIDSHGDRGQFLSRPLADGQAVNVGVWGFRSHDLDEVVAANRALEAKLTELGGRKWLYAYAYYSEEEFWRLYDRKWYGALRKKYHAETLPTVYDKVCRNQRQPVDARNGVRVALRGRQGIRVRD